MINENFVQFLGSVKIEKNELNFINSEYKTNTTKISNFIIEHSDGTKSFLTMQIKFLN